MTCKIFRSKDGKKWGVILENGELVFVGKTRVSCFKYASEKALQITEYGHGGNGIDF